MLTKILLIFSLQIVYITSCCILAENTTKSLKIISLSPATTEIIFSLGLEEEVVGVSTVCNYPSEVRKKEQVGTFLKPNIEKILALKPDIVFSSGLSLINLKQIQQLGMRVYNYDPNNIEDLFFSIRDIGQLTGKEEVALNLINKIRNQIRRIKYRIKNISYANRPKVYFELADWPLITPAKDSLLNQLIDLAGGINIANNFNGKYSYISLEEIIKSNPEVIILGYYAPNKALEKIKNRLGWNNLTAINQKRVYNDIDYDLLLRPGPRIEKGLKQLYRKLYLIT